MKYRSLDIVVMNAKFAPTAAIALGARGLGLEVVALASTALTLLTSLSEKM